jgi:hypothetical protein
VTWPSSFLRRRRGFKFFRALARTPLAVARAIAALAPVPAITPVTAVSGMTSPTGVTNSTLTSLMGLLSASNTTARMVRPPPTSLPEHRQCNPP